MVSVPQPKVILLNSALHLLFGHPAACGVGSSGGSVVTVNDRVPFLGFPIDLVPVTGAGTAGFCPGAWVPPGLVHVVVPVAFGKLKVANTLPFPRPAMVPVAVAVNPLSTTVGPFL